MNQTTPIVSRETFFSRLSEGVSPFGINLSSSNADLLFLFWQEVVRWNKTHNLTAITDLNKAINDHFIDSFLPASEFRLFSSFKKVLDLGTGAGFPGIPLSVFFPETDFFLLDKNHKKISFLHFVSGSFNLKNVFPVLESFFSHNEKYDAVVSRAVRIDDDIFYHCKKIINPGGYLIAYQSSNQTPHSSQNLSFIRKYDINGASRLISFYQF